MKRRLIVGITGASGAVYGIRILEMIKAVDDVEAHLVISPAGRLTIGQETDWDVDAVNALADEVHNYRNIGATIASGSFKTIGMVVAPCSMNSLAAIASGLADNLLTRAADVILKERRRLVLMPRETPLHLGHIRAMGTVTELGAVVAPPMPAMYTQPRTVDDLITHSAARVLDLFDIETNSLNRWGGLRDKSHQVK